MPFLNAKNHDLLVGRVLSEDKDFITIEIAKHDEDYFTLNKDDQFYTLLFVTNKNMDRGQLRAWLPWEQY